MPCGPRTRGGHEVVIGPVPDAAGQDPDQIDRALGMQMAYAVGIGPGADRAGLVGRFGPAAIRVRVGALGRVAAVAQTAERAVPGSRSGTHRRPLTLFHLSVKYGAVKHQREEPRQCR